LISKLVWANITLYGTNRVSNSTSLGGKMFFYQNAFSQNTHLMKNTPF